MPQRQNDAMIVIMMMMMSRLVERPISMLTVRTKWYSTPSSESARAIASVQRLGDEEAEKKATYQIGWLQTESSVVTSRNLSNAI